MSLVLTLPVLYAFYSMLSAAIELRDVSREYRRPRTSLFAPPPVVHAVRSVTLQVAAGERLGIVGESGSGKSVLVRTVMNLLPPTAIVPDTGSVVYKGSDVRALSPLDAKHFWGTEMAMVFQDPMTALNPVMKIGRQITESLRYHLDMDKGEARETAVALLRAVRIPEPEKRFDAYPHELSGGMRQRVVIAVALACGPKLLFADEPTTALDVTTEAQILDLMRKLQRDIGMAIMFITHNLGVIAEMCNEVVVMYLGKQVERADVDSVFYNPQHPYTQALLRSIPRIGQKSRERLESIKGMVPDPYSIPPGCPFHPRCAQYMPGICDRDQEIPFYQISEHQWARCYLYDQDVKKQKAQTEG